MDDFKIGILEPLDFSQEAIEQLKTIGTVFKFDGKDIKTFVKDKNVIFVRLKYKIDDELVKECKHLKYICSPTTGLNHIQVSQNIKILSLRGEQEFLSSIRATPEHILGLSISLLRNYSSAFLHSDSFEWNRDLFRGYELYNNKVGIIGMGRIGRVLSKYYNALGSEVLYFDKDDTVSVSEANKCDDIGEIIDKANIVILSANYLPENRNMIDKAIIDRMKGKFFINAARGELVDEPYLIKKITEGWFKGVAIDVFADETNCEGRVKEYLERVENQNVIITPHIGGATFTSMHRTEEFIAHKLCKEMEKNIDY